jgi:hypothetical protein
MQQPEVRTEFERRNDLESGEFEGIKRNEKTLLWI